MQDAARVAAEVTRTEMIMFLSEERVPQILTRLVYPAPGKEQFLNAIYIG